MPRRRTVPRLMRAVEDRNREIEFADAGGGGLHGDGSVAADVERRNVEDTAAGVADADQL